jgi:ribosomal protein S12
MMLQESPAGSPERLVSQREAAAFLCVSQSYLRASACPKVLLPGNGPKDRPLVRYRLSEVATWSEQWTQRATEPQRRAS